MLKANFENYVKGENMHEIFYEFLGEIDQMETETR